MQEYRKIFAIGMMSFSSGSVFFFLVSTVGIWLKSYGFCNSVLGVSTILTIPYAMKIFLSVMMNKFANPIKKLKLHVNEEISIFQIYKYWAIFSQVLIVILLLLLMVVDPSKDIILTLLVTFLLSCCAVFQDISIENYRVRVTSKNIFRLSISMSYFAFRFGMMASGAFALFIVDFFNWICAFVFMIFTIIVGICGIILLKEDEDCVKSDKIIYSSIRDTLRNFFNEKSYSVLRFMFIFKFCDSALHGMSNPFFIDLGYSNIEIASIVKVWWMVFAGFGVMLFNFLIKKTSIQKMLVLGSIGESISSLLFYIHSFVGKNCFLMFIIASIDSFVSALCTTAMMAYRTFVIKSDYIGSDSFMNIGMMGSFSSISRIFVVSGVLFFSDIFAWKYILCVISLISIMCVYVISKDAHISKISNMYTGHF
ncbi:hypothetical protein [Candidatus Gromoviella agglomerans]|uniref:hypothetical protein n=1 Tax=Candidatus Gromoviella agglomerans TaxID=2806609 RepID=UPI001E37C3B5|nr:hypothetical protein [Candidatus Gromoviella agglomerans]UFX98511.1 Muropeptide transporter [Candidatus Gromoviella agglomerans]